MFAACPAVDMYASALAEELYIDGGAPEKLDSVAEQRRVLSVFRQGVEAAVRQGLLLEDGSVEPKEYGLAEWGPKHQAKAGRSAPPTAHAAPVTAVAPAPGPAQPMPQPQPPSDPEQPADDMVQGDHGELLATAAAVLRMKREWMTAGAGSMLRLLH